MQTPFNPLHLDFASGDLSFWTAEGDAFRDQPVRGDVVKASEVKIDLVPLGGDYWDGPYPVGHRGTYWIHTRNDLTGTLTSDEFTIDANYPWFSFLIGGGNDRDHLRVELLIKSSAENRQKFAPSTVSIQEQPIYSTVSLEGRGDFYRVFEATGHDSEILRRVVLDTSALRLTGEQACIRVIDTTTTNHISVDDFCFLQNLPSEMPLAEDRGDPTAPVWGFADLHSHPMASLAFSDIPFWGEPDGPIENALASCTPVHGRSVLTGGIRQLKVASFEETGEKKTLRHLLQPGHAGGGYPYFDGWPKFTTTIHQQMYIDWIKRAYEGGLRLLVALAVNNELLAQEFAGSVPVPHDDQHAVEVQIRALKAFAHQHADWMQIAYSPAEARSIVRQNKLAIVLGVEIDSPGNWRYEHDCSDDDVRMYMRHLYHNLGVRHFFPLHLANNAFGGTALYMDICNLINHFLQGRYFQVEDGNQDGVEFRLSEDPGPALRLYRILARIPLLSRKVPHTLPDYRSTSGGHVNVQGLTSRGRTLIEEIMHLGLLIDIDHMSRKTLNAVLGLAEQRDYPVISGHAWFQELSWRRDETDDVHKCSHELQRTPKQLERIRKLGGMVAPILNQGDIRAVTDVIPGLSEKVPADSAGSSKSWAQAYLYALEKMGGRSVGIGTDMHGMAGSSAPRFGFNASYYLDYSGGLRGKDARRRSLRKAQVAAQNNGVYYSTPLKDVRDGRFAGVLEGVIYDRVECDIWRAIARAHAGNAPRTSHLFLWWRQKRIENFVKGFCATTQTQLLYPARSGTLIDKVLEIGRRKALWERKAAFLVKMGQTPSEADPEPIHVLYKKMAPLWKKWAEMQGTNRPLRRSQAGKRDFDINLEGVAHYGMLPDFIQDLKNVGLSDEDLTTLFRSVEDYIQTWEKCEQRKGQ
jgi:microsomal dipeptidase-like Zn-dependent dipeptidase